MPRCVHKKDGDSSGARAVEGDSQGDGESQGEGVMRVRTRVPDKDMLHGRPTLQHALTLRMPCLDGMPPSLCPLPR